MFRELLQLFEHQVSQVVIDVEIAIYIHIRHKAFLDTELVVIDLFNVLELIFI